MGSYSSSKQVTSTHTTAGQDEAIVLGAGARLNMLDSDSVAESFRLGQMTVNMQQETLSHMLGTVEELAAASQGAIEAVTGATEGTTAAIAGAYQTANRDPLDVSKMTPIFIAGFLTVGVIAWAASRKRGA